MMVRLLPEEERRRIDLLVADRSAARRCGDYDAADGMRIRIENETRVVVPWDRILRATATAAAAAAAEEGHVDGGGGGGDDFLRDLGDARRRGGGDVRYDDDDDDDLGLECKVVITDVPRSEGGNSTWGLMPVRDDPFVALLGESSSSSSLAEGDDDVLRLAHAALGTSASASERGAEVDRGILDGLVRRASIRLRALRRRRALSSFLFSPPRAGSTTTSAAWAAAAAGELHGRKAADAALWFALAGTNDATLYDGLVEVATSELRRFGSNPGCRAKDVLHVVERVAMAGIDGGGGGGGCPSRRGGG
jgi:hypothetical protein